MSAGAPESSDEVSIFAVGKLSPAQPTEFPKKIMIQPDPPLSTRQRLRAETQDAHQALEQRLPLTRRADLETYRDHLRFLLSFHAPLEQELRSVGGLEDRVPDLERRWKTPRLKRDLAASGEVRRAPLRLLPGTTTIAEAMGALYVLEGATLGARQVLQDLRQQGVLPGPVGSEYLTCYGADHGAMWRSFCLALDEIEGADADIAIDAARSTFEALTEWRLLWESEDE